MSISSFVKGVTSSIGDIFNPVSDLVGAGMSYLGQQSANEANSALSEKQMKFQEDMRKTQYQTSMKDMRKAGLNPILAYKTGGAGTPSGATAIMQNSAGAAVDSYNKTKTATSTKKLQGHQGNLARDQKDMIHNQIQLIQNQSDAASYQADVNYETKNLIAQKTLSEIENVNSARMANEVKKAYLGSLSKKGTIKSQHQWLQYLDIMTNSIGNVLGNSNSDKDLFSK